MGYSGKHKKNARKRVDPHSKPKTNQELDQDAQVISDQGAELEMKAATISQKVKDALARTRNAQRNSEELVPV